MTKIMLVVSLIGLMGCTHRGPASVDGDRVAHDSMALGNVKASATKHADKKNVCFDIALLTKDVKPEQAQPSNWSLSWIDKNNQTHVIPITHRGPASDPAGGSVVAPYGAYNEYTNHFSACASDTEFENVKAIVLTPRELPYAKKDGLKLTWNN